MDTDKHKYMLFIPLLCTLGIARHYNHENHTTDWNIISLYTHTGCEIQLNVPHQHNDISGSQFHRVFSWSQDAIGVLVVCSFLMVKAFCHVKETNWSFRELQVNFNKMKVRIVL